MPIIDAQRRLAEVGRIRIGQQVPIGKTGKTRPTKLNTFRLTSPDPNRIKAAAELYGGTVAPWQAPAGPQYEVITDATTLPVIVPPTDMGFSRWYELWSGGGCQRRCDSRTATYTTDGNMVEGDCLCNPDNRECTIHTRLSVMLRDLPGLGLWRLDTQGWNAALELQGAVDILHLAATNGTMLPAQLRLEQRMVKRPGQQTRRFAVPVLDIEITPGHLLTGTIPAAPTIDLTEQPRAINARLTPVPDTAPQWPKDSVATQIAQTPPPPKRRGQVPIAATGLAPRTAAQAIEDLAHTPPEVAAAILATQPPDEPVWPRDLLDMPAPVVDEHVEDVRLITEPQLKKLSILLREAGFDDRDSRHGFVIAAIGHEIDTAKNLTCDEASRVIDILENDRPANE